MLILRRKKNAAGEQLQLFEVCHLSSLCPVEIAVDVVMVDSTVVVGTKKTKQNKQTNKKQTNRPKTIFWFLQIHPGDQLFTNFIFLISGSTMWVRYSDTNVLILKNAAGEQLQLFETSFPKFIHQITNMN